MRDEILAQLRAAMPVDGVLLGLHGAMIAEATMTAEGDIIARVREIVGPKAVIGVELDPHCHLTEKRVRGADIVILFKEYPHTDFPSARRNWSRWCSRRSAARSSRSCRSTIAA